LDENVRNRVALRTLQTQESIIRAKKRQQRTKKKTNNPSTDEVGTVHEIMQADQSPLPQRFRGRFLLEKLHLQ